MQIAPDREMRGKPGPSGRGRIAQTRKASVRCFLLLDVLAHKADGRASAEAAKYEGDQRTPGQYFLAISGRRRLSTRLEAPFRLFTSEETDTVGGYSIGRWTWSLWPSISTS